MGEDYNSKLLNLIFADVPQKEKELLQDKEMINYKYFLQFLVNFKIEKRNKIEIGNITYLLYFLKVINLQKKQISNLKSRKKN